MFVLMSTICDISLPIWFSQGFGSACLIFGISILWWGRIGKVFQFVGGITVLFELIGIAKVKEYGEELVKSISQLRKLLDELLSATLKLVGSVIRFLISTTTWKLLPTFIGNVDIGYSVVTANLSKFNNLTSLSLSSSNPVERITFYIFRSSYILLLLLVILGLFSSLRINKEFFAPLLENGVTFPELIQAIFGILFGFSMIIFIFSALNLLSILFSLALIFILLCCLIIFGVTGKIINFLISSIAKLLIKDKLTKWIAFIMFILGSMLDFILS